MVAVLANVPALDTGNLVGGGIGMDARTRLQVEVFGAELAEVVDLDGCHNGRLLREGQK